MKAPIVKPILYISKVYSDGTHPIMVRITKNRKRVYKAIGYSVLQENWDFENDCCYEKKPAISKRQEGQLNSTKLIELKKRYSQAKILSNASHINSIINDAVADINNISDKLKINEESLEVENFRQKLNPKKETMDIKINIHVYGTSLQEKYLKSGSVGTYKRYKVVLDKLLKFKPLRKLEFSMVDLNFLEEYELFLQKQKYRVGKLNEQSYKVNTIHNHLKTLRAIYYSAIKEEIISQGKNPFIIFKLKSDNSVKKDKLDVAEIIRIETLELDKGSLIWHIRNCFLFSFYCAGIRVGDLLQLKWENITASKRVEYKMDKTGGFKSVMLIPKAIEILEAYKNKGSKLSDYIFPLIDSNADLVKPDVIFNQISSKTALINKYLKKIAILADIEKPLTTHIARHSFSDIARKRGANIYDISKMLGHSSIKITEAYLASIDIESQDSSHSNAMNF